MRPSCQSRQEINADLPVTPAGTMRGRDICRPWRPGSIQTGSIQTKQKGSDTPSSRRHAAGLRPPAARLPLTHLRLGSSFIPVHLLFSTDELQSCPSPVCLTAPNPIHNFVDLRRTRATLSVLLCWTLTRFEEPFRDQFVTSASI